MTGTRGRGMRIRRMCRWRGGRRLASGVDRAWLARPALHRSLLALALSMALLEGRCAAQASVAADICSGTPCTVTGSRVVDAGSDIDFGGSTDLRLAAGAVLEVGPSADPLRKIRLRARSIVLEPGARILGDGDAAAVSLEASGGRIELQASGSTLSRIDVSGLAAGSIDLVATGDVLIAGTLLATGIGADAQGGEIAISAGGRVATSRDISVAGSGTYAAGGGLRMNAVGNIEIDGILDASASGDGGIVDLDSATGDLTVRKKIDASGGSPEGLGGAIDLFAATGDVTIAAPIMGTGGTGIEEACGDGSEVNLTAGRSVTLSGSVTIDAGTQCFGGSLTIVTGTTFTQSTGATISALGPGSYGGGGSFSLQAGGDAILRSIDLASPGYGGSADLRSSGGSITIMGPLDARASGVEGIGGTVDAQACTLAIASTGRIDTRGTLDAPDAGITRLKASGSLTVAGPLLAGTANELRVKAGAPTISASITPAASIVVDPTLPDCIQLAACGDGTLDPTEACDDDNIASCDGCRADCSRPDAICGDGIAECGEQCDDGNTADGDGCEGDCTLLAQEGVRFAGSLRPTAGCLAQWELGITDIDLASGGFPAITQACVDGDPSCDRDGSNDMSCTFDLRVCLRVPDPRLPACLPQAIDHVNLRSPDWLTGGTQVDRDNTAAILDALRALGGEVRVSGTPVQSGPPDSQLDHCTQHFTVEVPRSGTSIGRKLFNMDAADVAGLTMGSNQMRLECRPNTAVCGNGIAEPTEQCDDGNRASCDGCSASCGLEVCGDGIQQCGEQCDLGPDNGVATSRCSAACTERPPALRIPGGGTKTLDCPFEWSAELDGASLAADVRGVPKSSQICRDNDPSCDFDAAQGSCRLRVWGCFSADDPRLGCSAAQVDSAQILSPGVAAAGSALASRLALDQALRSIAFPAGPGERCTERVEVDVPLTPKPLSLKVRTRLATGKVDVDVLKLKCIAP